MKTDKKGTPVGDHLRQLEKQTGITPAGLIPPVEFPEVMSHVWQIFVKLHKRRPSGFGPSLITYEQIQAWKNLAEHPLMPWEVEVIEQLDELYMRVTNE